MIRNLFGGATKCRTVDKLDMFNDGSCKALYRFDGNANDESGNYHGTETNVTYGGGVYDRGAVFNGSAKISLPLGYFSTNMSFSFWASNTNSGNIQVFITTTSGSNNGYAVYKNASNKLEYTNYISGVGTVATSSITLSNTLTHYSIAVSGTIVLFYINGSLVDTKTTSVNTSPYSYNAYIGAFNDGTYGWTGSIDQLRIFNRAITAQEVATLYAECEPTSIIDNINPFEDGSLKALYKFDGDATDATGVHNGVTTNVTYTSGKFGNCAVFNGSSSKIVVPVSFWNLPLGRSVSFWLKAPDVPSFVPISGTTPYSGYIQRITANNLTLFSATDASLGVLTGVLDNTWHFITIVETLTASYGYKDGVLIFTSSADAVSATTTMNIGCYSSGSLWFNGSIDQVRIFNKALTPLEVASLYNETTPMEEQMSVQVDPFKDGSGKALYRLEGNALDESGNYNLASVANIVYEGGRFGRCIRATSATGTNLPASYGTTNFTVSLWIKENIQSIKYLFSFKAGNTTVYNQFYFANNVNTNRVSVMVYSYLSNIQNTVTFGTNVYETHGINFAGTQVSGKLGEWYMVTATYDGTTLKAYENGVLIGSANIGSGWSLTNGVVSRLSSGTGESIDQIRVFNRALTQSEVTALYNEI